MSGSGVLRGSPDVAGPTGRISKIRNGLTRQEWTKVGLMAATILGLNVVGWGMLALALHNHLQLSRTVFFGFGTGVPAPRRGVPTTHLHSIPRRYGRRLLVSARDLGVAGTAPD